MIRVERGLGWRETGSACPACLVQMRRLTDGWWSLSHLWLQVLDAHASQGVGGNLKRAVGSVAHALGAIKTMFTRRSRKASDPVSEL